MKTQEASPPASPTRVAAATVSVLVLLAVCARCAGTLPSGPYELWPIGPDGTAKPLAEPIAWSADGVRLDLEPLTAASRAAWLRAHAGTTTDPLGAIVDPTVVTFRLRLTATGDLPIHLETQSLRLLPAKGGSGTAPFDYTRAFELLRPDRESGPKGEDVRQFMKGLLDGAVDVAPGLAREGLLVFPDPAAESRMLVLVIPFLQLGADTHQVQLAFEKVFPQPPGAGERR